MKLLNLESLEYLIGQIKAKFVQKTSGKDLSTNDFDDLAKEKLDQIESGANKNKIELITRNGSNLSIDSERTVDINVPTKISQVTNDKGYQTKEQILDLIGDGTGGGIRKEVVEELPDVNLADPNTFYLIRNQQDTGFEEWMIVNGAWEILGDTASVDFTGYLKKDDIEFITTEEIDVLLND